MLRLLVIVNFDSFRILPVYGGGTLSTAGMKQGPTFH